MARYNGAMATISLPLRRTPAPPIPAARLWADRYDGRAGPLIDLTQAVPGYPPHPDLLARLSEAAARPENAGYGPIDGTPLLREALARDIADTYRADITAADVAITAGANLAFAMAATAVAAPGDAVMLPAPWYFNHAMALQMHGIEALPLPCDAAENFLPDPDRAESLIDDRVRAIVLITPNNPTGAIYPPALIARFADLCRRRNLWLILDETYRNFLPGRPHAEFGRPDWRETIIHIYSFSKAYCVPGHRLGALVAGGALRAELLKILDTMQICPQRPAQSALAWAIPHLTAWRDANQAIMSARAEACRHAVDQAPGWALGSLGGYFAYLRLKTPGQDAVAVAETLAAEHGLATLPGPFFGPGQESYLRLAFANVDLPALAELPGRLGLMAG